MYINIILLPLLAAIIAGFGGRFLGRQGAVILTTSSVALSSLLSMIGFYQISLAGTATYIRLGTWIDSEMLVANWGFLFDSLTITMCIVVTLVSSLVHLYGSEYMSHDPHLVRFMSYLSLFTFFMLMLITADNFIQMFLGWEGVGLSSYLLINFWYSRIQANQAAMKAMIVNRVGDFGLGIGMLAVFYLTKSIDFATVFALVPNVLDVNGQLMGTFFGFEVNLVSVTCFFLFIGAVGKSAQIGLHTWLPDAMEGPTPVSALIHAATMVTAGVFLIIRCSPLFEYAPDILYFITFVGAITAFFAATTGVLQNDLKRVIAYSTCSQLGYMVFACGISNYSVSMFHLMNHAFFKALLFLSAGVVIHAMRDEQDMRKMGGLVNLLPFTYSMMVIGSLSLMGFPFLTGFYSKDLILELAYAKYTVNGTFAHWLGCISALFTSFYSFRLLWLTFLNRTNAYKVSIEGAHDAPIKMAIPLIILAVGSIFIGYLTKDMIVGLGSDFWANAIYQKPENVIQIDAEFIPFYIKLVPVALSLLGAATALVVYSTFNSLLLSLKMNRVGYAIYMFLNKKWYFDKIYNWFVVRPSLGFGYHVSFKTLDRGLIELVGPYGLALSINALIGKMSKFATGFVYHYAFVMMIGLMFFIGFFGFAISFPVDPRLYVIYLGLLFFLALFSQVTSTSTSTSTTTK